MVRSWLERPCAWVPEPGPAHLELLDQLLRRQNSARLITDAHIAAIALERGLRLCSRDHDFARWADLGLRCRDPFLRPARRAQVAGTGTTFAGDPDRPALPLNIGHALAPALVRKV